MNQNGQAILYLLYFCFLFLLEYVSKGIVSQVMQARYECRRGEQTSESGKQACQNAWQNDETPLA